MRCQAYFLCKYGLDASVFAGDGPFGIESTLYGQTSQFEVYTFREPTTLELHDGTNLTGATFVYDLPKRTIL